MEYITGVSSSSIGVPQITNFELTQQGEMICHDVDKLKTQGFIIYGILCVFIVLPAISKLLYKLAEKLAR